MYSTNSLNSRLRRISTVFRLTFKKKQKKKHLYVLHFFTLVNPVKDALACGAPVHLSSRCGCASVDFFSFFTFALQLC